MLRTRLWMGAILIALAVAVLTFDPAPWYPCLFALVMAAALLATGELRELIAPQFRPSPWFCYPAVAGLIAVNWLEPLIGQATGLPWRGVATVFAAVVLAAFLIEMAAFEQPGRSVPRIALATWTAAYLGLLPCFLVQLRWLPGAGAAALALAVFVPKMGDTGAYFTGRLLGRHKMAPVLSPKKTWEGAAGGLTLAVGTAIAIDRLGPVLPDLARVVGFGLTVGLAGLLGDLAESLVKRDGERKDASQVMPGFGGVLDVVDSIVFAAPVAYCWFSA
jgi:phosphatidate cytidylyltransferase